MTRLQHRGVMAFLPCLRIFVIFVPLVQATSGSRCENVSPVRHLKSERLKEPLPKTTFHEYLGLRIDFLITFCDAQQVGCER